MNAWTFGPKLRRMFEAYGVPWQVLDRVLTAEELGSSPGDCYYDGTSVILEYCCPVAWVAHELAHWLVCKVESPRMLVYKNYGLERDALEVRRELGYGTGKDHELLAAQVTICVLIECGYPWRQAARDMSIEPTQTRLAPGSKVRDYSERLWTAVRATCMEHADYLYLHHGPET